MLRVFGQNQDDACERLGATLGVCDICGGERAWKIREGKKTFGNCLWIFPGGFQMVGRRLWVQLLRSGCLGVSERLLGTINSTCFSYEMSFQPPCARLDACQRHHALLPRRCYRELDRCASPCGRPRIGEGRADFTLLEIKVTHFNHSQRLSQALLLRCNLAIAAGNAGEAVKCIQGSLRLAEAYLQEPVLIGLLVGSSIHASTMNRVWALLQARIASKTELATLQEDISRLDLLAAMLRATREELAAAAQTFKALRLRPDLRRRLFGAHDPRGANYAGDWVWRMSAGA